MNASSQSQDSAARSIRMRVGADLPVLFMALLVGILGGCGAIVFSNMIEWVQWFFYQDGHDSMIFYESIPFWRRLVMPACGGLLAATVVYLGAREAKGHGVAEVIEAVALRDGLIRKRVAVVKLIASAFTIGTGGSAGREGPIVQIGAGIGSTISQLFRVSSFDRKTLVGCGAAAGIAASFNAPVAGVLFAVEIIMGEFRVSALTPVALSSVAATAVSRYFLGDAPVFVLPPYELLTYWEYPLYLLLGIFCAGVALVYMKSLVAAEHWFGQQSFLPEYLKPALGGLMVGLILLAFPHVFGVGHKAMDIALSGQLGGLMMLAIMLAKIIATSVTLGSGGSGGSFAPAMFIGAMAGGFFGSVVGSLFPGWVGGPGAYAMVAMGAMIGGTTYAPITAILMVFEMSGNYNIILPLMLSCIISTLIASQVQQTSIYTTNLRRKGIELFGGINQNILKSLTVSRYMKKTRPVIDEQSPLGEVIKAFKGQDRPYLYVLTPNGRAVGVIAFADILRFLDEKYAIPLLKANEIARSIDDMAFPDDSLQAVLHTMNTTGLSELPVLNDTVNATYLGVIRERDILVAYQNMLQKNMIANA